MHRLESSILGEFKREPSRCFSTSEMVREIFKPEFLRARQQLHSTDPRRVRHGSAAKAQLHRKLLYHVNKLVERRVLKVSGVQGKGEKLFELAIDEGELVVQDRARTIVIAKRPSIITPIDSYEQRGLVRKYRDDSWLNKQTSILLDMCAFSTLQEVQHRLQEIFPVVSDVIALWGVEKILQHSSIEEIAQFLNYVCIDAQDYDVRLSFLLNVKSIEHEQEILAALEAILERDGPFSIVCNTSARLLAQRKHFFHDLFLLFSRAQKKLTIKNMSLAPQPIYYGRTGTYSFPTEDWEYYREHICGQIDGCVVGQFGITIDLHHFFQQQKNMTGFREFIMRTAHTFFEVEERRRRYFSDYFEQLTQGEHAKEFFRVGRKYIRFWNYDWAHPEAPLLLDLLESTREELENFSRRQETIFRSCGLPIRFSIGLSTGFSQFDQDFFSERRYKKTVITSVRDLHTAEMRHYLRIRERLFKIFQGADRLRFFLHRRTAKEEVYLVARYLLSGRDLHCFTLDFRGKSGEMKLSAFMEN